MEAKSKEQAAHLDERLKQSEAKWQNLFVIVFLLLFIVIAVTGLSFMVDLFFYAQPQEPQVVDVRLSLVGGALDQLAMGTDRLLGYDDKSLPANTGPMSSLVSTMFVWKQEPEVQKEEANSMSMFIPLQLKVTVQSAMSSLMNGLSPQPAVVVEEPKEDSSLFTSVLNWFS